MTCAVFAGMPEAVSCLCCYLPRDVLSRSGCSVTVPMRCPAASYPCACRCYPGYFVSADGKCTKWVGNGLPCPFCRDRGEGPSGKILWRGVRSAAGGMGDQPPQRYCQPSFAPQLPASLGQLACNTWGTPGLLNPAARMHLFTSVSTPQAELPPWPPPRAQPVLASRCPQDCARCSDAQTCLE